jgi:hypothetical protein
MERQLAVFAHSQREMGGANGPFERVGGGKGVSWPAEPLKQSTVPLEIGPQHSGNRQDEVPMRHRRHHPLQDKPGSGLDGFLVAGGTEPAAFAGERHKVFVLAMVAADAGEAALQVAAVQEFVDHLGDDRAQPALAAPRLHNFS